MFSITIDYFQRESNIYYDELLPNLLIVKNKLVNLNAVTKYCELLIKAISWGTQTKFEIFLNLENGPVVVITARVSPTRFKLRWVPINKRLNHGEKEELVKIILPVVNNLSIHIDSPANKTVSSSVSEEDEYLIGKKIGIGQNLFCQ